MTETTVGLDLDLCRRILLRLEEVLASGMTSLPAHYEFDRYTPENISYSIRKLFFAKFIKTTTPENWTRGQLSLWPVGFQQSMSQAWAG